MIHLLYKYGNLALRRLEVRHPPIGKTSQFWLVFSLLFMNNQYQQYDRFEINCYIIKAQRERNTTPLKTTK